MVHSVPVLEQISLSFYGVIIKAFARLIVITIGPVLGLGQIADRAEPRRRILPDMAKLVD